MIIKLTPFENGTRPPMQSWNGAPPEGYATVQCDTAAFYQFNGFVTLTVDDGVVTGMVGNVEAWEAWQATLPPPSPPEPTPDEDRDAMLVDLEYRLTLVELGVTEGGTGNAV